MQDQNSQPQAEVNNKKLFVGSLPWSVTSEKLAELFAQFGEFASDPIVLTDKYSGRSKGFGFVEYTTEEAAQAAIDAMHESELEGRTLVVNIARPRAPRRFDNRRGGYSNRRSDSRPAAY